MPRDPSPGREVRVSTSAAREQTHRFERQMRTNTARELRIVSNTAHPPRETSPPGRTLELVWRPSPGVSRQPLPAARSEGTSLPPASARSESEARVVPLQPNDLTPALLDRLTDDVIRRVEKRARIERARRGL